MTFRFSKLKTVLIIFLGLCLCAGLTFAIVKTLSARMLHNEFKRVREIQQIHFEGETVCQTIPNKIR
jgi:hypothetical protein